MSNNHVEAWVKDDDNSKAGGWVELLQVAKEGHYLTITTKEGTLTRTYSGPVAVSGGGGKYLGGDGCSMLILWADGVPVGWLQDVTEVTLVHPSPEWAKRVGDDDSEAHLCVMDMRRLVVPETGEVYQPVDYWGRSVIPHWKTLQPNAGRVPSTEELFKLDPIMVIDEHGNWVGGDLR